jgi:hypothetical protein
MHAQDSAAIAAADALTQYFETHSYGHAPAVSQVLERLPNGDYAWLRSEERAEPDDALYVPTQSGRDLVARWRAQEALFSHPWPTVADVWRLLKGCLGVAPHPCN